MGLFTSTADRRRVAVHALLVTLAFVVIYVFVRQYLPFLRTPERFRTWLLSFGIWAPVVFIVVQTLQIIVAPIPGQVVGVASGYVFGVWYGTLYSMIGTLIGTTIAFAIARRYGRAYVERFVAPVWIERFDEQVLERGRVVMFGFFLVPGLPDDVLCFVAGLSKIAFPTLIVIAMVGRFPSTLLFNLAGDQAAAGELVPAVSILLAIAVVTGLVLYYREAILAAMARH